MPDRGVHFLTLTFVGSCVPLLFGGGAAAANPEPAVTAPAGVELPSFQPGLWEYRRTLASAQSVKPQASSIKRCANPEIEIREKLDALKKKGCQFEPLKRHENRYTASWTCPTTGGAVRFRDVLTVKDATHYEDLSEMRSAQQVTQQKIEAKRLGECPAGAVGTPGSPNATSPPHP